MEIKSVAVCIKELKEMRNWRDANTSNHKESNGLDSTIKHLLRLKKIDKENAKKKEA